jgi:hypothetical protein
MAMTNSLIQALRDQGNDAEEAQEIFEYLRDLMHESPDEVEEALHDEGLEPDYLIDLL